MQKLRNYSVFLVLNLLFSGCTSGELQSRQDIEDNRKDGGTTSDQDADKDDGDKDDGLTDTGNGAPDADTTDTKLEIEDANTDEETTKPESCCGKIGPLVNAFTPSGPIRLTSGQVVTGLHISNPDGPCILGYDVENVMISNNKIGPCAPGNNGIGIEVEGSSNVTIMNNHFEDVASAFYAASGGKTTNFNNLVFKQNYATKVRGPMARGQMVQFNGIHGSGHLIECNISDQAIGGYGTGPEDHINMFDSHGKADSPIHIRYNRLRGGGADSGGGILAGDHNGSHTVIESNILVNAGQYGISISGGINHKLLNNLVFAEKNPWTNVGLIVVNWTAEQGHPCYGHEVRGNRINYTNKDGAQSTWWHWDNCGTVDGRDEWAADLTLTADIWDSPFPGCE